MTSLIEGLNDQTLSMDKWLALIEEQMTILFEGQMTSPC